MRIAVCLSGIPRCYDYHIDSIKNLFAPHQVDIFCHFWREELVPEDYSDLITAINPCAISLENQPTELFNQWYQTSLHLRGAGRPHNNVFPMWYSVYKANWLKRLHEQTHNFKYNAVCKARTDLWFPDTWTQALDHIADNTVIIPHDRHYDGYTDVVAVGDSWSMDQYSDLWNYFPEFLRDNRTFTYEITLKYYLDEYVKLNVLQVPVDYRIVRPSMIDTPYHEISWNAYPSEPGIKIRR